MKQIALNDFTLPDLFHSLYSQDLGHLQIIAEAWGLEFTAPDARIGLQRLVPLLLDERLLAEVLEDLEETARRAFYDLIQNQGRLAWAIFTRRYGLLHEIGLARRDRDRPYLNPAFPTEALWYRGLIAHSFFDTPNGLEEFAYIPADLLELAPKEAPGQAQTWGRLARQAERAAMTPASDAILDHACTFLAAARIGLAPEDGLGKIAGWEGSTAVFVNFLRELLTAAGLLDASGIPLPEPVRIFLEESRGEALSRLVRVWRDSRGINELRLQPGLLFEGGWQNDARRARQALLDMISAAPGQGKPAKEEISPNRPSSNQKPPEYEFVNLASFVQAVHQFQPDFQRPAGDYDSWFIRERESGNYLRGFDHWGQVDGEYLRFMICGPIHWLGLVDLAASEHLSSLAVTFDAFRLSKYSESLLKGEVPPGLPVEDERWQISSSGRFRIHRLAPRVGRYQIARFCLWEEQKDEYYRYRITPISLERARQQGLQVSHLLSLIRRYAAALPPALLRTLERWEVHGPEAHFEKAIILRVKDPAILLTLRSGRAARFFGDSLGPTAIVVKPTAVEAVLEALMEMGYLSEVSIEP